MVVVCYFYFFPPFSTVVSPSFLYWNLQVCLSFSTLFVRPVCLSCFSQHLDALCSRHIHHPGRELSISRLLIPPLSALALAPGQPGRAMSQPLLGLVAASRPRSLASLGGFLYRAGSHLCVALHGSVFCLCPPQRAWESTQVFCSTGHQEKF